VQLSTVDVDSGWCRDPIGSEIHEESTNPARRQSEGLGSSKPEKTQRDSVSLGFARKFSESLEASERSPYKADVGGSKPSAPTSTK
jgi:hypothetical protein